MSSSSCPDDTNSRYWIASSPPNDPIPSRILAIFAVSRKREIRVNGWALEVRINAEDPFNGFAPQPGKVEFYLPPQGQAVRVDSHLYAGYQIPPHYDSMIAKIIVHAKDREGAIARMLGALDEMIIDGVKTNIPFQKEILSHVRFRSLSYDTSFTESLLASGGRAV